MLEKAQHGKRGTYTRGCHCALCREANTEYIRGLRSSRVSSWVSVEESRDALKALRQKFSVRELAVFCGVPVKSVYHIMSPKRKRVWLATAEAIATAKASLNVEEKEETENG